MIKPAPPLTIVIFQTADVSKIVHTLVLGRPCAVAIMLLHSTSTIYRVIQLITAPKITEIASRIAFI